MQLMPEAAARAAGDDKLKADMSPLFEPGLNLRVGQDYLAWLMERGVGHDSCARSRPTTAARRIVASTAQTLGAEADDLLLIECLPAFETRAYVQKVWPATGPIARCSARSAPTLDALACGARDRRRPPRPSPSASRAAAQVAAQPFRSGRARPRRAARADQHRRKARAARSRPPSPTATPRARRRAVPAQRLQPASFGRNAAPSTNSRPGARRLDRAGEVRRQLRPGLLAQHRQQFRRTAAGDHHLAHQPVDRRGGQRRQQRRQAAPPSSPASTITDKHGARGVRARRPTSTQFLFCSFVRLYLHG